MLDVFNNDAFSTVSLTESLNKLPYTPSRLGSMGLFKRRGVPTTKIAIEEKHGTLRLLPTKTRGTPGTTRQRDGRSARVFVAPHIPYDSSILADDVLSVRKFGSEDALEAVSEVVNNELESMKMDHEVTHEWHRIGAVKGLILDADGSTTIYDLFDEFGLTQTTVSFDFTDTSSGYIKLKCQSIKRSMEDALGGTPFTGITALCGDNFFDKLVAHTEVASSYDRWREGEFHRTLQDDSGFQWGNIRWENYRGQIGAQRFVDTDKAHFFPTGGLGIFVEYNAPANFIEAVGTIGKPYYAKKEMMKFDMGVELHTQSNPLMLCTRPQSLIEGSDANP